MAGNWIVLRASFYVWLILLICVIVTLADDPFERVYNAFNDEATVEAYANCFLDKQPCSGDARAVKRLLPEVISTRCARCSQKQRQLACKIINTLKLSKYSKLWNEFLLKYDPSESYRVNLNDFLEKCEN